MSLFKGFPDMLVSLKEQIGEAFKARNSLALLMNQVYTATHCNTLQHTARQCNTLQHTATHCNTLQQHTDCAHESGTHSEKSARYSIHCRKRQ